MNNQNIFDDGILNNLFHCKNYKMINFEDFLTYKCPICLNHFGKIKNEIVTTRCNHKMHKSCLNAWLTINLQTNGKTCPLCRMDVKSDQKTEDIERILNNENILFRRFA